MTSNDIKHLRDLTDRLPPLDDFVKECGGGIIEYESAGGFVLGLYLHKEKAVGVQRAWMSKGAKFAIHTHSEIEMLVVYKGRLKVISIDQEREIGPGECVKFSVGEPHCIEAIESCWMIGITVPAAVGYPGK